MAIDRFGYGVEQIDQATQNANKIAQEHLFAWNRLVENKSPIAMQKDRLQWQPRVRELTSQDTGFENFLHGKTIKEKMIALRDSGMQTEMDDRELTTYLLNNIPSGLTEDPQLHKEARAIVKQDMPVGI